MSEELNAWIKTQGFDFLQPALATAAKLPHDEKIIQLLNEQSLYLCRETAEISHDKDTLSAALLLPYFSDTQKNRELISASINATVYKILSGTKKMHTFDRLPIEEGKAVLSETHLDSVRRLLLAIVDDARIVLLKLVERVFYLESLRKAPQDEQQKAARQAMFLYAPLANRLGIGQLKWQLEDWAFRYLEPEIYKKISKALKQRREDRDAYIKKMHTVLDGLLHESGITDYELSGRAKHIYSIHRKLTRKEVPFEELYDTNAFRILVKNIQDCYTVLSHIHARWKHIEKEFDDYIAKPKSNGYQSIHTVILGPEDRPVEIQIRTFKMHEDAELGVAAHWKYKEGKQKTDAYEEKINLLRDIMHWQEELNPDQSANLQQLFADRVYVFTPNNDILDLQAGATPLDVAYHIHTQVGHHCKGAKVNDKMVPLTHKVKTGDVVEIITATNSEPSRDWMNAERGYLATPNALNKVKVWFHRQFRLERIAKGQEIWDKALKREQLSKADLQAALTHFKFKTSDDLLIALASGNLGIHAVIRQLRPMAVDEKPKPIIQVKKPEPSSSSQFKIAGTDNLLTQLARCCRPIPGDTILGYITKTKGVSIHRRDCKNISRALVEKPERILDVDWGTAPSKEYPVDIEIVAADRQGLVRDITTIITNEKVSLLGIHTTVDKTQNRCVINLTVEIASLEPLNKILNQFRQLPNMEKVYRKG